MCQSPILFLVFNRPDTTARVFEAIRIQRPTRLYVAADGPRTERAGEKEKCRLTRELATQVDWPCEVRTLFREENLGCGKAVSQAISWFFEQEEEGIILEDDCLPHPDFFGYCTQLLERYRHEPSIKVIGGNNFQQGLQWGKGSYYYSAHAHIWGWASWRRAWQEYSFDLSSWQTPQVEQDLSHYFFYGGQKSYWKHRFRQMQKHEIDTWDYQLTFSIWKSRGLAIIPNVNLVENIGFGAEGTHTLDADDPLANLPAQSILPLRHPEKISLCKLADFHFYRHQKKPLGKLEQQLLQLGSRWSRG